MGPGQEQTFEDNCLDLIRHQLLTSLFTGRSRPGERAPSVRRMAALTGRSRRSVHEAYQVLAEEGLLEARRGSGTFFPDASGVPDGEETLPAPGDLAEAARSCTAIAKRVGLPEQVFARFFAHYVGFGVGSQRLAIVECNGEQLALMSEEIETALGVKTREMLLDELAESPRARLEGVDALVTTICHQADVERQARSAGVMVYTVAMSRAFLSKIIECAAQQPTLLVVRDLRYAPVLRGYLEKNGHDEGLIANLAFSLPDRIHEALARLPEKGVLCLSGGMVRHLASAPIAGWRVARLPRFLDEESLERLRIEMALGLALAAR